MGKNKKSNKQKLCKDFDLFSYQWFNVLINISWV